MADELTLWISTHLAEKIRAHGAEAYPHECCGALLGRDSEPEKHDAAREVQALLPLVNRHGDSPRNRFIVTPEDVLQADREAQQQGLELIGWYHSHPDHPARPSQFDLDHAWPWYSYVIVSVQNGAPVDMTSWRLNDDRQAFSREGIEVRHRAVV